MYTTRLVQLLFVALSIICVAQAFPGDLHNANRRVLRRQNKDSSSDGSSNASPTSAAEETKPTSAAVDTQSSEEAPSASSTPADDLSTVIVTNTIKTTASSVPQTTEQVPETTSEEPVSSTDPVPDPTTEKTTAPADPTTVVVPTTESSINNDPVPTSSSSELENTSVLETTAAPQPTSTAVNDATSSDNKNTQQTTFTPVTSTFIDVVTKTNSNGALETMTTTTKSTSTPGLNSNESSSSSGMSTKTRNTVIGVVVGIGGSIVVGALALVAWRIWGRKKQAEENDGLMDYNSGYNPVEKSEPGSSGGNSNPPQRNPFQSTLENYHQPTPVPVKTSPSRSSTSPPPSALAQDGSGDPRPRSASPPRSPALSTASTADGDDDIESSPVLPPLPAPRLPDRALELLRTPPPGIGDEAQFGTASWGSPYPRTDRNLRRQSFSSDASEESPIHHLAIGTPFLRPAPELLQSEDEQHTPLSAAAAVLANRARRQATRGLTEDWIRTHTTDDLNSESRHWFSDGDESEHSSLSGSESGWLDERDLRTPRATQISNTTSRPASRHTPRARSSTETLKAGESLSPKTGNSVSMATDPAAPATYDAVSDRSQAALTNEAPVAESPMKAILKTNGEPKLPATPTKLKEKPLPKEPAPTPRLKKKVPWRGKNILVLLPRDEERGLPGKAPMPLRQNEISRMFSSWQELGYDISGFDLEVEGYQPPGTDDSQSRDSWPNFDEVVRERVEQPFKVTLPDLNAWKNYVNELQEAKLRALGVSFGDDEPEQPSISPATTNPSRQPSAQYPPLPFSPPLPTSSASSNHAMQGFPFPASFVPGRSSSTHSPGLSISSPVSFTGAPGKFNPRQSISFPATGSPFGFQTQSPQGWPNQAGILQGLQRHDSPNGMMSPGSPYAPESPSFGMHQRHQSLQYPMLAHQQFSQLQPARNSPRLQEVREDEEEVVSKSPSKTPEPPKQNQNPDSLQAEIDDAEYHLEEQLRNQLEHEDYNPQPQTEAPAPAPAPAAAPVPAALPEPFVPAHERQLSAVSNNFPVPERFANDPPNSLVLHHPRPHSRGHSLTQNFFRDSDEVPGSAEEGGLNKFQTLNEIPESHNGDESYEIETNPSNLGTPVQNFEFPNAFGHQKTLSTVSNPWNDAVSVSSSRPGHSSHGSKASLSKLNVQAPEFKLNPGSSFTPGQFSFSTNTFKPAANSFQPGTSSFQPGASSFQPGASTFQPGASTFQPGASAFQPTANAFQPTVFQAGTSNLASSPPLSDASAFQPTVFQAGTSNSVSSPSSAFNSFTPSKISPNAPAFSPGTSSFSFSTSGPKFRPDAPAFTPLLSDSATSPAGSGSESVRNRGSIFGSIDMKANEIIKPSKKSKAVPIIRPTSSSANSPKVEDVIYGEDRDGRMVDESRFKRARSSALDGEDVPLFAEQPTDLAPGQVNKTEEEPAKDDHSAAEGENTLPVDTSMSSIVTSDQIDTNATTATPSETSPDDQKVNRWAPFEFDSKMEIQGFNDARPFGEDTFKHKHKKTLSATAPAFTPGVISFGEEEHSEEEQELFEPSPVASPISARPASGLATSGFSSPPPQPKPVVKGLGASRFADPPPKPKGLAASRYAREPTPEEKLLPSAPVEALQDSVIESVEHEAELEPEVAPVMRATAGPAIGATERTLTFEEIDAVMQDLENNPAMGVNKYVEAAKWQHGSPTRNMSIAAVADSSPYRLEPPTEQYSRDEESLTPREYRDLPEPTQPMLSTELEDPFVDPPSAAITLEDGEILEDGESLPASDWEAAFSEDEHDKLENRAQFFDGRVNEVVGNLLASRLEPLEKTLFSIQDVLAARARRTPSSRRDMRSVSAELQPSDADDEDEEPIIRRSMSPRRDRRMDQIRVAVMEGLAAQQRNQIAPVVETAPTAPTAVLEALEEMKQYFGSNLNLGNDLKNIVEDAVERRMPTLPKPDVELSTKVEDLQAKLADLEQKLYFEQTRVEKEVADRRAAEDLSAELNRKLSAAETRVEVEIINRSVFDQRVADLEEKLRHHEEAGEEEIKMRRNAEDRLSEVQRLLRISSEEETRLREAVEEKDQRIRAFEQSSGKTSMRMALLEAAQNNATQSQSEMTNKINTLEADLRNVRQDNTHWRTKAEHADEAARRKSGELARVAEENQHMQKSLNTLTNQLEENERLRESWRGKFMSLQEDMARAAREIAEENARRIKKDQVTQARQEVLDARLQAEAKTRERLEIEMERLQTNERTGMRAVNECKRLEGVLLELKNDNHKLEKNAARYQREFEEARESGVSEVKRTRMALQTELDSANNQVNIIRDELEEQNSKLRTELDNVRLEADTTKAQNEMLLEEAQSIKASEIEEIHRKHQNEIEDLQTRYERQVNNAQEDAHKAEQHLLERLSLSTSKTEHLQDRILHLEEKLEIAKEAAAAAAQAAKSANAEPSSAGYPRARNLDVAEKISPQALRESIMVLQEQLQAREQRIEELEHATASIDPDAATKITKRDDEISWLRELLAVRHENLQDIIAALSGDSYDPLAVKDAAIRLKANLQMEEQERERAMNGGSAINLPNIAQTIQAATPRVAQAVGPIAAAWGNWRKGNQGSFSSLTGVLNSPAGGRNATPSRSSPAPQNNLLGGLLTPPTSSLRQTPPVDNRLQPTAFANTGRRYMSQAGLPDRERVASNNPLLSRERVSSNTSLLSRDRVPSNGSMLGRDQRLSNNAHRSELPASSTPPRKYTRDEPVTPPMMRPSVYDSDAQPGDFDDNDFFEED
ncbi:Fc.00g042510.m01.CDS01 [Cosmosporella sp. VM-42]